VQVSRARGGQGFDNKAARSSSAGQISSDKFRDISLIPATAANATLALFSGPAATICRARVRRHTNDVLPLAAKVAGVVPGLWGIHITRGKQQ